MHPLAAQQIAAERVTPRAIPAGLTFVGTVEDARRWTDRNGQNLLVLTRTEEVWGKDSLGNDARSREIHGYHFIRQGSGYRILWQTIDFVRGCGEDIVLEYAPGSVQVTDVDHDGIAETTYVYAIACMGGMDPADMKLILHEGATKYAIRGFQDLRELGSEYPAPEMHVEPALSAHSALRDFAVAQWRRFVRYSAWHDIGRR
jgi:hypothetical protein